MLPPFTARDPFGADGSVLFLPMNESNPPAIRVLPKQDAGLWLRPGFPANLFSAVTPAPGSGQQD